MNIPTPRSLEGDFRVPDFGAPLDVDAVRRAIPAGATIKGMFPAAVADDAAKRGARLASALDRYVPFKDYPLAHHADVLLDCARAFFPRTPTRQALRRLGWFAHRALDRSLIGSVMMRMPDDVGSTLEAAVRAYPVAMSGVQAAVVTMGERSAIVRLANVWTFLDCHHVGVLEGVLRRCHVDGSVTLRLDSPSSGEIRCNWTAAPVSA
jgi:hypothetical protein